MTGRLNVLRCLGLAMALGVTVTVAALSACSPEQSAPVSLAPPLGGAWAPADAFSPEVQEAARFAVQTFAVQNKARLLYQDVTQARQHGVADLHFELQLQVNLNGADRQAQAMVWLQTDGRYSLQAWDWLD